MDPFQQGLASGSAELRSMDSPFWVLRGFGETGGPRQSLMYGTPVGCCFFGTENCLFSAQKNRLVPKKTINLPDSDFTPTRSHAVGILLPPYRHRHRHRWPKFRNLRRKSDPSRPPTIFRPKKNRSRSKFSLSQVNMIGLLMVVVAGF